MTLFLFCFRSKQHPPVPPMGTVLSPVFFNCSKRFTFHPLADLFIPRPSQLLWEAFSHAAIARRLFVHISTTVCIARYSFIQLSELWQRGVIKLAKGSKRPQWDLKPGSLGHLTGMPSRPGAVAPCAACTSTRMTLPWQIFQIQTVILSSRLLK